MSDSSSQAGTAIDRRIWRISSVVLLGPLITSLDSTVVNVSLATLGRELHVGLTTLQWVITGYLLALALMLPLSGWLVHRAGAKRIYLTCFTCFTVTSMLCGLAHTASFLIAARVLQGMAGGLLAPMAQMMVAREARDQIARVMALLTVPVLLGPIFGPSLAGLVLEHLSWRWIFFINLPVGLVAIALAAWLLPRDVSEGAPRRFDLRGFLLISPGLVLLLYSLEGIAEGPSWRWLLLGVALVLLVSFVRHSQRLGREALIDVSLFRVPSFSAAASTQFLANAGSLGGQMLLPLYMLTVLRISPSHTGALLAPLGLGMLCSYPSMGVLTSRFGSRRVSTTGAAITLLGTLPFAFTAFATAPHWLLCIALFVRGVGTGGIGIPSIAAAYSTLDRATIPVATAAINIVQRLGGPAATTVLAIVLHLASPAASGAAPSSAFAMTFAVLCLIHAAAIASALRLPLRARPKLVGTREPAVAVEQ